MKELYWQVEQEREQEKGLRWGRKVLLFTSISAKVSPAWYFAESLLLEGGTSILLQ